jgi:ATP-dependent Lon protease
MPLFIGRKSSVNAITQAMGTNKYIFLVAQKDVRVIGFFSQCLKHQSRLESLIKFYPVVFVH